MFSFSEGFIRVMIEMSKKRIFINNVLFKTAQLIDSSNLWNIF
jgi:hypothetical protein